jgi:hypothetical protein
MIATTTVRHDEYEAWIETLVKEHGTALMGQCQVAVRNMVLAFPELRAVAGHSYGVWGKRGHWWLVAPDGEIVDPTISQFPGPIEYEEWVPGSEVRVGKCMNCGEEIWERVEVLENIQHKQMCSEACERDFIANL